MGEVKGQESWVIEAKRENIHHFSELDLLLRSLDRFFIVENLPISSTQYSTKNFLPELSAVKDLITRVIGIIEAIMPEEKKNEFWFKKYAENRLMSSRDANRFRHSLLMQDTQEKSLFLMYDSMINLKTVVSDLLKTQDIPYMSYRNIGQLISSDIRENAYFNPFSKTIDPDIDFIENSKISEIVRKIADKSIKKPLSILFLQLFRLLRYLRHIDRSATQPLRNMHVSISILSLLKMEYEQFRSYAESTAGKVDDKDLSALLKSIAYQFMMETRRVYNQEMKDILHKKSPTQLRGRIENSHGILNNLTEQAILQLAQHWDSNLKGDEVFLIFTTKKEQSMKLREDLYVLTILIKNISEATSTKEKKSRIITLINFMDYFETFTFKLLRHDDYDGFMSFFTGIRTAHRKKDMKSFFDKCSNLSILIEATIQHIEHRAELKDKPLDIEKAMSVVKQYISIT